MSLSRARDLRRATSERPASCGSRDAGGNGEWQIRYSALRRQAGATLLEALAFLGIAAIVIVGAISMFRSAQSSAESATMIGQLQAFRSAMKTLFASQATYTILGIPYGPGSAGMNTTIIAAKAVPDSLRVVLPTQILPSWGGYVAIDGNGPDFWIQYTNVPRHLCIKVAPQTGASWQGLTINANPEVSTDAVVFPVSTATTQCVNGNNTMTWRGR